MVDVPLTSGSPSSVSRLRTSGTNYGGVPYPQSPSGTLSTGLQHLVYTRDSAGNAVLYVDGVVVDTETVTGTMANWDSDAVFTLVNDLAGTQTWTGDLHLSTIYDRALDHVLQVCATSPGQDCTYYAELYYRGVRAFGNGFPDGVSGVGRIWDLWDALVAD